MSFYIHLQIVCLHHQYSTFSIVASHRVCSTVVCLFFKIHVCSWVEAARKRQEEEERQQQDEEAMLVAEVARHQEEHRLKKAIEAEEARKAEEELRLEQERMAVSSVSRLVGLMVTNELFRMIYMLGCFCC